MGPRTFNHAFDAFGKLHSFKFYGNGSVSLSTKFLRSEFYNTSILTNNVAPYTLFEPVTPRFDAYETAESFINGMDNTNVNIIRVYNKQIQKYEYMTMNDIWKVYKVDGNSLNTLFAISPEVKLDKLVYVAAMSSAHPAKEYGKENYITFLTRISKAPGIKSEMTLYRMNTISEREEMVTWVIDEPRYIHSFSVTQNYVVILAPPITVNTLKLIEHGDIWESLEWSEKSPLFVYLIDINTSKVTTLKYDDTVFFFHHINAYEIEDTIVVDVCTLTNSTSVTIYELKYLQNPKIRDSTLFSEKIKRFIIDVKNSTVQSNEFTSSLKVPYSTNFDFPVINEKFRHMKYCFAFGKAIKIDNVHFNKIAIVKKDLCGTTGDKAWTLDNNYPSEAWFVPTPGVSREDDGVLLTHVFDGIMKETYLVIINATTMVTISRATLPINMPISFHGRFFEDHV